MVKEKKEKWFKSRRVWASIFATIGAIMILFTQIPYVNEMVAACGIISASLGGYSFVKPK